MDKLCIIEIFSIITIILSSIFIIYYIFYFNVLECYNGYEIDYINYNNISRLVLDNKYYSIENEEIEQIIRKDNTNMYEYIIEMFDCDEFGFILMSNIMRLSYECRTKYRLAFGIIIGYNETEQRNHLMNFFVDKNLIYWCVEPQNDYIEICDNIELNFNYLII